MNYFFEHHHWLLSENGSGNNPNAALTALTWQDTFLRYLPLLNQQQANKLPYGILHFYEVQYPSVILGPKDTRLKNLHDGLHFLHNAGYATVLRAHGGLAVVSDAETLNVSFVTDATYHNLAIDQAYEQLVLWVHTALAPWGLEVESYEIANSYCPGTYDLVVNKRKIGGIAQRRFKTGIVTAAYLSVGGNQTARSHLIRDFYQHAQADQQYPNVQSAVMATINNFLPQPKSVNEVKQQLISVIPTQNNISPLLNTSPELISLFEATLTKTTQRNQTILID